MENIAIFGAGGFGREVKMLIDQINDQKPEFNFIGYFDDGVKKNTMINGFPVLGGISELNESADDTLNVVFAIGTSQVKKEIVAKVATRYVKFPVLIHPNVLIGKDAVKIGEGSIICAGTVITVNIDIGKHVIVNLCCTIGHDTVIGDYASFMPSVNISGEVQIENSVYLGTGAKVINQLSIGENSIIGAGAVVSKNIPPNCTAVGVPAKPIKFH